MTQEQIELLDTLWSMDTIEQVEKFKSKQKPEIRREIEVLVELVMLASLDETVDTADCYPEAEDMFMKLRKKD